MFLMLILPSAFTEQNAPSTRNISMHKMTYVNSNGSTITIGYFHSLSLHFSENAHFPGLPGLASTRMSPLCILMELKVMEVVVTTGAIRHAKLQ